ncbi:DUF6777 domain-containing protein [Streptomyces sp. AS02]|uniref:DUF6777 domain-containing protein n=1 Tax=Streptomyces sp. AS02 TaxID=2938946 RepID=UPI002020B3D4|nr:DUF6777 domain-containing protein [Streptomyces sp. AS02]MCL8017000.1 hypothetical protein [Streptomyces sp. AS02]
MSVEPPSSGRPTGPPSGPLSGPSQPPAGPPSQPPSDTGGGAPGSEPHHPWWRSVPRIATLTAVVVAAVLVAVVLSRGGGGGSGTAQSGEVFLQAASSTGPDPFTESTAKDSTAPPVSPSPATESAPSNAVRGVDGGAPGLYSGSRNVGACDVEKQITYLQQAPAENRAFASVARIGTSDVASYLRSLTPVQLRMDTRVTNHGYRDGGVTSYQAVLQAGTAVFVDDRGVPRLRCACGNPLTTPVAQQGTPKRTGDSWPSYRPTNVVVVSASTIVVKTFVIYDPDRKEWLARPRGDDGRKDKKTEPPAKPSPSVSVSTPTSPTSPSTSISPSSPSPSDERRKEEPTTTAPTTTEPTTTEPTTTESTTKSESPETSPTEAPSTTGTTTSQSASQSESQSAPTTGVSQSPSL